MILERNGLPGQGATLARRLADYVVLAHDPAVRDQPVDFWELSQPHYAAATGALAAACAGQHQKLRDSYHALTGAPGPVAAYRQFAALGPSSTVLQAPRSRRD
jgi:hypothetical protein